MSKLSRREVLSYLGASVAAAAAGAISGCGSAGTTNINTDTTPPPPPPPPPSIFDVVIVGATPSGILAAEAALRAGATVAVVDYADHVGGILTSGIGTADSTQIETAGGLTAKFFQDIAAYYGDTSGKPKYSWEPRAAEAVFNKYLDSQSVWKYLGRTVNSATKKGAQIQSIMLDDGTVIQGKQWIDASYEGDLMDAAGVSYTVGRESSAQYGEKYAGWGYGGGLHISPYLADGSLIPGVNPAPGEEFGQADEKIMAYGIFCCVTSNTSNMMPFPKPPGYDPNRYAGVALYINFANITTHDGLFTLGPVPNEKYGLENEAPFSSDYANLNWAYPNADWPTRQSIHQDCDNYVAGFLYFLANDPSVPASVRADVSSFGLPLDEFTDNNHWPHQMYVREGRRLIGQYVMTESDVTTSVLKADSVGIGQKAILDSHTCDRCVTTYNGTPMISLAGGIYVLNLPLYQLPFRSLLPNTAEVTNLAVPVCSSASHIAWSSIRVEPTLMLLGEAAGTAAGLAVTAGIDLSAVDISEIQDTLVSFGGLLEI